MTCGFTRQADGRPPLVCEREAGHAGRHALLSAGWPYCSFDNTAPVELDTSTPRYVDGWTKPHKRRAYQAPGQWVAPAVTS